MVDTKALEARRVRKAKKPAFRRQDAHKKREVARTGYRKPKGLQSKMRLGHGSYARMVSTGFSSPKAVKGLTRDGLRPVMVATLASLKGLDPKAEGAVIVATVGAKKREAILAEAKRLGITIINAKDVDAALKRIADARAVRKGAKQARIAKVKKTVEERVETVAEQEKHESSEEKADELEAEKQKVLTKRM